MTFRRASPFHSVVASRFGRLTWGRYPLFSSTGRSSGGPLPAGCFDCCAGLAGWLTPLGIFRTPFPYHQLAQLITATF